MKIEMTTTTKDKIKSRLKELGILLLILFISFIGVYIFNKKVGITKYYCIDRYATYKELKKKYGNNTSKIEKEIKNLATKYNEGSSGKGYIQEYKWKYKKERFYFSPKQESYTRGNQNISKEIEYLNTPCRFSNNNKTITCDVGFYTQETDYFNIESKWKTINTRVEGNIIKTTLRIRPTDPTLRLFHNDRNPDIDICYVEGKNHPLFKIGEYK